MNLGTSFGIHAAVSKELGGQLVFPGSETFYTCFDCFSCPRLHAQFNLWAAMEPRCSSQAFNVVNGDRRNHARTCGLRWQRGLAAKCLQINSICLWTKVQAASWIWHLAEAAAGLGLQGKVAPGKAEQRIDLVKWSQRSDVKKAWEQLAAREGLEKDGLEKATRGFLDFVLGRNYDIVLSMSKARRLGWNGYIDTWDLLSECFDELEMEKVLPKTYP